MRSVARAMALIVLLGGLTALGTAPAAALPVTKDVGLKCVLPGASAVPATLRVTADVPAKVAAGERFEVELDVTLSFAVAPPPVPITARASQVSTLDLRGVGGRDYRDLTTAFGPSGVSAGGQVSLTGRTSVTAQILRSSSLDLYWLLTGVKVEVGADKGTCDLDPSGNAPVGHVEVGPPGPDTVPPAAPGGPVAARIYDTLVSLDFTPATDDTAVGGYRVYDGDRVVGDHPYPSTSGVQVIGLTQATTYTFTVRAYDLRGNLSAPSEPVTFTTVRSSWPVRQRLSGSLRTGGGTAALGGSIEGRYLTGGFLEAQTDIAPTTITGTAWGFLAVTAELEIVPLTRTTGSTVNGVMTAGPLTWRLELPTLTVLGVTLRTPACAATITPKLTGPYDRERGGSLRGVVDIPAFGTCGSFGTFATSVFSGPGNDLTLDLGAREATP
ncbi:fibronectin type III domain-containing protein [Actinocorallia longicatena]